MKKKKIKQYLEKRMTDIEKYAAIILSVGDEEAIHQLRVGVKKLRAFLRLAGQEPSIKKKLQVHSKLKKIYKYAGRVRDLQIYDHNIVPFFNKAERYPRKVLPQIAGAKYSLFKAIRNFHFQKSITHLKKKAPDRISKETLGKFIHKKNKTIDRLVTTKIQDAELHSLKKHLKDVTYSLKSFHATVQNYLPIAGKADTHELDKLSDMLGEYLDYAVGLTLLNTALSGKLSKHDKAILERIKKSWTNKKARARRRALVMLRVNKIPF
ncbi:CHAD domain-containing protein [Pedobacter sp. PLR]|uniref:CHAD domain-containing protein n=1 Tax=Pedobacter sp. PLR TaxID=2994465 RepID=UPI002245762C|nr:CHAD domain-containing protein [Pedobacter sp. PLR]MCX2453770.1 CHAD domain-containing protein [Pedobacter sp. PLR]